MRPKGWKNDPRWLEHYAKADAEREQKAYKLACLVAEMEAARQTLNYRISKAAHPMKWEVY